LADATTRRRIDVAARKPVSSRNLDGYGNVELPWERVQTLLDNHTFDNSVPVVSTVRPNGLPHAVRVGAIYVDGDIYFVSHPQSRRARNLAAKPATALTSGMEGIDVSFEGESVRVTDPAEVAKIAEAYSIHGWPAEAIGDQITAPYNAPSAGPAPWNVYRFRFTKAIGGATAEPYGATAWEFAK
jgi:hypothetical protein